MHKGNKIGEILKILFAPKYGYYKFLNQINKKGVFLDVGCGSSTSYIKTIIPESKYIGLDIVAYSPLLHCMADKYVQTTAEEFVGKINSMKNTIDTVFSLHNLEHCNRKLETVRAMALSLKTDGMIYITFPSEKSIGFPNRKGTLNYYDDKQHTGKPPIFDDVVKALEDSGIIIKYKNRSYKPFLLFIIGLFLEPFSALLQRSFFGQYGTWAFWGFEAVIWGVKKGN